MGDRTVGGGRPGPARTCGTSTAARARYGEFHEAALRWARRLPPCRRAERRQRARHRANDDRGAGALARSREAAAPSTRVVNTDFRGESLVYVLTELAGTATSCAPASSSTGSPRSRRDIARAGARDRARDDVDDLPTDFPLPVVSARELVGRRRARDATCRSRSATRSRASATRRAPPARRRACSSRGDGCGRTRLGRAHRGRRVLLPLSRVPHVGHAAARVARLPRRPGRAPGLVQDPGVLERTCAATAARRRRSFPR